MHFTRALSLVVLGMPTLALAQQGPDLGFLIAAIGSVGEMVTKLIPLTIAIGLLVFIWSVIKFIANSNDGEARDAGLRQMGWGIVGLFLIVSVWGVVSLLADIVGITPVTALVLPTVPQ